MLNGYQLYGLVLCVGCTNVFVSVRVLLIFCKISNWSQR